MLLSQLSSSADIKYHLFSPSIQTKSDTIIGGVFLSRSIFASLRILKINKREKKNFIIFPLPWISLQFGQIIKIRQMKYSKTKLFLYYNFNMLPLVLGHNLPFILRNFGRNTFLSNRSRQRRAMSQYLDSIGPNKSASNLHHVLLLQVHWRSCSPWHLRVLHSCLLALWVVVWKSSSFPSVTEPLVTRPAVLCTHDTHFLASPVRYLYEREDR